MSMQKDPEQGFPPLNNERHQNWHERFEKFGYLQDFYYLDGKKEDREEERRKFLNDEVRNPTLDYPRLTKEELDMREEELLKLKGEILAEEEDEVTRLGARWRINQQLAVLRMLKAAADSDMRRFKKYSEFIYGKPNTDIFAYTVQSLRAQVEPHLNSENIELKRAAKALMEMLPKNTLESGIELPGQSHIASVTEDTRGALEQLIDIGKIEGETFDAEGIRAIFSEVLRQVGGDEWKVVIDEGSRSGISVHGEQKEVRIPASRTLSKSKLVGLIVHEIVTHVGRHRNGRGHEHFLMRMGLDRAEQGDEGLATMREQALRGKMKDFAGLEGYLAIGLAYGLDGKSRDFRAVYEILEKYFVFKSKCKNGDDDENGENGSNGSAKIKAWNRCVRTFRGTDCKTQGVCFTRDIIYRHGNIGAWSAIRNDAAEMERFQVGVYDPGNLRHLWIMSRVGVKDGDLAKLSE